jgi:hypothetical protein
MLASTIPRRIEARPAALLVVESDAVLRDALAPAADLLVQCLTSQGYDVVVASSPEEARLRLRQRSFDKVFGDSVFLLDEGVTQQATFAGSLVEDQGDGTARVQINQIVPWPAVIQLLDLLTNGAPENPGPLL